ncbi:MAG: AP2/ERF family transcription factor [Pseudomonadota bacterium]
MPHDANAELGEYGWYGLSRIDDQKSRCYGWRVSLRRDGTQYVKTFHDKKCGGRDTALELAKEWRDHIAETVAPMSRYKLAQIVRANNQSGITGVCRYTKRHRRADGSYGENSYWEANWPTVPGKHGRATFAVKIYGEAKARELAITARSKALTALEGFYWKADTPGAVRSNFGDDTTIDSNEGSAEGA